MKKGSKRCKICNKFTPEPKEYFINGVKVNFCHPCYVHLLSSLHKLKKVKI